MSLNHFAAKHFAAWHFLPLWSESGLAPGIWRLVESEIYLAGAKIGQGCASGTTSAAIYVPGIVIGEAKPSR